MKELLQIWSMRLNLERYLGQMLCHPTSPPSPSSSSIQTLCKNVLYWAVMLLNTGNTVALIVLGLRPPPLQSAHTRAVHFDLAQVMHAPPNYNLMFLAIWVQTMCYHYGMYRPAYRRFGPLVMLYRVLVRQDHSFFLDKYLEAKTSNKPRLTVCSLVNRILHHYALLLKYFAWVLVFLLLGWSLGSILLNISIGTNDPAEWLMLTGHQFAVWLHYLIFASATTTFSMVLLLFSVVTFIRLGQVNDQIVNRRNRNRRSHIFGGEKSTFISFSHFSRAHSTVVRSILYGDRYLGRLLFAFMVVHVPGSTYLTVRLLERGWSSRFELAFSSQTVLFQCVAIFCFHLLAAQYTRRIHRCSPWLLSQCALNDASDRSRHLSKISNTIKLHHYVERFHCHRPYGLTYGPLGRTVSVESFLGFIGEYVKLLIFWKQIQWYT